IGADLPKGGAWLVRRGISKPQLEKSGVAAIEKTKTVAPRLDTQIGPCLSIDDNCITEEFWDPEWVYLRIGRCAVKPCRVSGRKQPLAVGAELAILYAKFDLVASRRQVEPGAGHPGIIGIADQIKRRQPRIDIEPGHSQYVIVKPQRRSLLCIGIGVDVG